MKKVKVAAKLGLNKETVARLNNEDLKQFIGGATKPSDYGYSGCGPCYSLTRCAGHCNTFDPTGCTGAISGCQVCVAEL